MYLKYRRCSGITYTKFMMEIASEEGGRIMGLGVWVQDKLNLPVRAFFLLYISSSVLINV